MKKRAEEERDAWRLYAANTRNLVGPDYFRVEPWAWSRLSETLLEIEHKHRQRERVAA